MRQTAILNFENVEFYPVWKFWKPSLPRLNDILNVCIHHDVKGSVHQFINVWMSGTFTCKFIINFWEDPPHTWLKAMRKKYKDKLHLFNVDEEGNLECENVFTTTKHMTTTFFDYDAKNLETWQTVKNNNVTGSTHVQGLTRTETNAWDGIDIAQRLAKLKISACVQEYTRCDNSRRHLKITFHETTSRLFGVEWWYVNASKMNFIAVPNGFMEVNNEPVWDKHLGYHTPSLDGRKSR